jgi:predicted phage tail protein
MPIPAIVPNPFDDDAKREARMEANLPTTPRRAIAIVAGGVAALIAFGILAAVGYPGTGAILVPFGVLMVLLGGIELLLSRL